MAATEQLTLVFEGVFDSPSKIDAAHPNVIPGVKICGPTSKNGYKYELFSDENARLYEGVSMYVNHGKGADGRDLRDWYGTYQNVKACPGEKCFRGDLHFLDAVADDPATKRIKEAAEKGLKNCGSSHVISIDETKHRRTTKEGTTIIGMKKVHSVDVVMNPATTNGMHESHHMSTKTAKDILLSFCRFDREKGLIEALGDVTTVEVALKDDATVQEQVTAAFEMMGQKAWNDDAKRAEIVKAKKALLEGVVEERKQPEPPKPGEVLTYQEAHKLCDEQKVTSSASLLEALTGLSSLKANVILEQLGTKDKEITRLGKLCEGYEKAAGKTSAPGVTIAKGTSTPGDPPGQGNNLPTDATKEAAQERAKARREQLAAKN